MTPVPPDAPVAVLVTVNVLVAGVDATTYVPLYAVVVRAEMITGWLIVSPCTPLVVYVTTVPDPETDVMLTLNTD